MVGWTNIHLLIMRGLDETLLCLVMEFIRFGGWNTKCWTFMCGGGSVLLSNGWWQCFSECGPTRLPMVCVMCLRLEIVGAHWISFIFATSVNWAVLFIESWSMGYIGKALLFFWERRGDLESEPRFLIRSRRLFGEGRDIGEAWRSQAERGRCVTIGTCSSSSGESSIFGVQLELRRRSFSCRQTRRISRSCLLIPGLWFTVSSFFVGVGEFRKCWEARSVRSWWVLKLCAGGTSKSPRSEIMSMKDALLFAWSASGSPVP